MISISALLLSVFITIVLIPILSNLATRFNALDMPDMRKIHTQPMPRIGGLAIAIGAFIPIIFWGTRSNFFYAYLAGGGILGVFGLMDDLKSLNYKLKFLGQILAAMIMVFYGGINITYLGNLLPDGIVLLNWFAVPLTLLVIVGVTNAINLADGMDGLAGGISLLSFFCIGYFAYLVGDNVVFLLSVAFSGAIFGFLRYNTYPASIFMGDTGSQLLGFSAIVLALKVTQENHSLSPVLPLVILGFPILDTLTVMVERVRQGRSPFSPDKNHFHHRLTSFGFYHTEAVVTIYLIQASMIILAILFRYYYAHQFLIAYLLFSGIIIGVFTIADRIEFRLTRYRIIDHVIKGKLRRIKDNNVIIRVSFEMSKLLIPLIFPFSCFLPRKIPLYAAFFALCLGLMLMVLWMFAKDFKALYLRIVLYLTIPLILYFGQEGSAVWVGKKILMGYHILLSIIALFVILTVKFSRRARAFHITPMDFLILFIAVIVPYLPGLSLDSNTMGFIAVKLVVLLFSYEVLLTELRGKFDILTVSTFAALGIIVIRGFM